jgi:hypothetical protein
VQEVTRDLTEEPIVGADGFTQAVLDPRDITRQRDEADVVDESCHVAPSLRPMSAVSGFSKNLSNAGVPKGTAASITGSSRNS